MLRHITGFYFTVGCQYFSARKKVKTYFLEIYLLNIKVYVFRISNVQIEIFLSVQKQRPFTLVLKKACYQQTVKKSA